LRQMIMQNRQVLGLVQDRDQDREFRDDLRTVFHAWPAVVARARRDARGRVTPPGRSGKRRLAGPIALGGAQKIRRSRNAYAGWLMAGSKGCRFARNCSADRRQENCKAYLRQASGARVNAPRAAAARSSRRTPTAAPSTTSRGPGTGKAAIGTPEARASSNTRPKVSVRLGNTKTSAAA